jgi:hypothetical protein
MPDAAPAQPIEDYLRELDALIAAHDRLAADRLLPAVAAGRAPRDVVRRLALESYYLGKWMTPEVPVLIANAPDVYSFTMDESSHYRHWARSFADETGYLGDPNRVAMKVEWCRQLGLSDDDVRAYTPIPETIAMACTMLFYVRRSYEEGLAVFGYAGERVAAGGDYAKTMSDGLRTHYGVAVRNLDAHTRAEPAPGATADRLFRQVATTRHVQDRCREAVRNVLLTAECRVRAMNRWVE